MTPAWLPNLWSMLCSSKLSKRPRQCRFLISVIINWVWHKIMLPSSILWQHPNYLSYLKEKKRLYETSSGSGFGSIFPIYQRLPIDCREFKTHYCFLSCILCNRIFPAIFFYRINLWFNEFVYFLWCTTIKQQEKSALWRACTAAPPRTHAANWHRVSRCLHTHSHLPHMHRNTHGDTLWATHR